MRFSWVKTVDSFEIMQIHKHVSKQDTDKDCGAKGQKGTAKPKDAFSH